MTQPLPFNSFYSLILSFAIILFSIPAVHAQTQLPTIDIVESAVPTVNVTKATSSVTLEISQGVDNSDGVHLPLELASFTGVSNGCTNILNWSTATEVTTSHFEILKSSDGLQYTVVDAITAAGTSVQLNHYNYSHQVSSARTYYRLRIFDVDGTTWMTDVVVINAKCKILLDELSLYPNPTNDDIKLTFSAQKERTIQLFVIDGFGRIAIDKQFEVSTGDNTIELTTNELTPGSYHIKIQGDYFYRLKFIKIQ